MKHVATRVSTLLIFILWLGNIAFAGSPPATTNSTYTLPVDSPKKETAPAPQMVTYPLSLASGKFKLSGYGQVRYQYFTDTLVNNGLDVRRARINMTGSPFRSFDYRIQIDFAPTTRVLDVTAAYTLNTYLKITAGQQKIPFSLENIVSSNNMESINRSQVVEALVHRSRDVISTAGNNNGRDIGLLLSGAVKTKAEEPRSIIEYSAGVFNGNGINKADNNREVDFSGRLLIFPIRQLSIGGSYYNGSATYGIDLKKPKNRDRFGAELYYNTPRISVKAEFIQGEDSATTRNGYYVQLAGFIIPEKFQAVVKYDVYDSNTDMADDVSTIYMAGLNWYFNKWAKIQFSYDMRREQVSDAQKDNDFFSAMVQLGF